MSGLLNETICAVAIPLGAMRSTIAARSDIR